MRRSSVTNLLPLLLALIIALAPTGAALATVPSDPAATEASGDGTDESRWGVLAAIGCGAFVRATIITAGTQIGTIVGAVACCGYMLFDAGTDGVKI